jgi:hypothetical protein
MQGKYDIIVKQKLTLNQNIIANIILPHLYTTNIIFFNRVLIASEKKRYVQ